MVYTDGIRKKSIDTEISNIQEDILVFAKFIDEETFNFYYEWIRWLYEGNNYLVQEFNNPQLGKIFKHKIMEN